MPKSDKVEATCTEDGTKAYWTCKRCRKMFSDSKGKTEISRPEVIEAGHKWELPIYKWSDDNKTVTATRVCLLDESHVEKETAETKSKVLRAATDSTGEEILYTAEFQNPVFDTQTKTVTTPTKEEVIVTVTKPGTSSNQKGEAAEDQPLTISEAAIKTKARSAKKQMIISWKQAKEATDYQVAYRKAGARKWKYRWTGATKINLSSMKKNGLYVFKIQAVKKDGDATVEGAWSKVNHRFYATTKGPVTPGKTTIRLKIKKVKKASGYQVLWSFKKSMKDATEGTSKGPRKFMLKVKKLESNRTYYVRVRPYKAYKGVRYVGILSRVKMITTR